MMTVTPKLGNLVIKYIGCIHISYARKLYVSVVYNVVHCASVLSCSRPSIRQMGGGMHLLIRG